MTSEALSRWRYRVFPDHLVGEILSKPWIDNSIPFALLLIVIVLFGATVPAMFSPGGLAAVGQQLGETLFVVLGLTIVILAGGIDLSVGSTFALGNFLCLGLVDGLGWPVLPAILAVVVSCSLVGLVNGVLIGYLRLRAFLTTLGTLIIVRAIDDTLGLTYGMTISAMTTESAIWDFIADGKVLGIPLCLVVALAVYIMAHLMISRTRLGWHILAVGGSRRSAHNAGIAVRRTVCLTYVMSGALTGLGSAFYAARLNSVGPETGLGLEITVLTAAVVGGNSLGGGRGSTAKALLGTVAVVLLLNGLIRWDVASGVSSLVLGAMLLFAVSMDIRWLKNRQKILARFYVSPIYVKLPPAPVADPRAGTPYAMNDKLQTVETIGLGTLDGPEDVIFDRHDNLYTGSRHGDIIRFLAPDYRTQEVFAHVGGFPLGLAMDPNGSLVCCVAGMGLYRIAPDRSVSKLTDETNRSLFSVVDDARMRLADDLDIAPDGRIFFSEATIRYEQHEWIVDALESRGNGRIICYDPARGSTRTVLRNLQFPNGICMVEDGDSLLFAETWGCRVSRYWHSGPRRGTVEPVVPDLPGYPDNINRASDGHFWVALCGMRTPIFDLALRMPDFRSRMARRVAPDEWMYPNMNTGCVVKFSLDGAILDVLWDLGGRNHPMITSIREHRGYLYLGGISNNRIGRYRLAGADAGWTSNNAYWGTAA